LRQVVIRIAGDSGDGIQLAGDRFAHETALAGNDFSTLPNYPAEIRAPQGTIGGVSSYQLQLANYDIHTPGDRPDVLVAFNPAALKANIGDLERGGLIIADTAEFTPRNLAKVGYANDPLQDQTLDGYQLAAFNLTAQTLAAVADLGLGRKDAARAKNFYVLGLLSWIYERPAAGTVDYLQARFQGQVRDANVAAFKAGYAFGETTELARYEIAKAPVPPGTYRQVSGNRATAYGLMAAAARSGLKLFMGAYPITPASDILHILARAKEHGVMVYQAEDEIAACGAALGASYAGDLAVTATSGPGLALKTEMIGLAVMLELPLVVVDVQRGGPSTGLPTKTEQADLLQAMFGRHGEAPLPVIAADSPSGCFDAAFDACRIALEHRTPVILLTDGYLANGAEPWAIPDLAALPEIKPNFTTEPNGDDGAYHPYHRDPETLARAWALPGTPGLEHHIGGLEKDIETGEVSYSPINHAKMVELRRRKIEAVKVPDVEPHDPTGAARVLVVSWGSTQGATWAAAQRVRESGRHIADLNLRHLNPLPSNLGEVLKGYRRVIVPELNSGQLSFLLRARYLVDAEPYRRMRGLPLSQAELAQHLKEVVDEVEKEES
jgi:2-oxoglutarate ferredoxin oxidoreductase subunit alpha